ncbi:MAG: hypothetical protein COA96_16045 [SAR86 cluster bacterium]|uniref:YdhG-like domain-containing protein n=1 Tax=SAR86 cluster bacterium TaxID=2030880 RepID=A0A2A5ALK7_9GAMM|nr:MAG: hypothetical protein COA96_16045 [SAR86 cluster bacterium]
MKPTIESYLASLADDRQPAMTKLRSAIVNNLPSGFEEIMENMPSYVVPLSLFPAGYHCTPNTPLPFISFASQKNFVALYHFGMYADQELKDWFVAEYPKHMKTKLDMGKSCVRFKKPDQIPFELIAELAARRTVDEWLACYQNVKPR